MNHRNRMPTASPRARMVVALGTAVLLSACGNVTSGGAGDMEVMVTSDEMAETQGPAASMLLAEAERTAHGSSLEGTLTVRMRSYARTGAGDLIELTDGVQEVTLSLSDPAPIELAQRRMPAGSYGGVRIVFERIQANVTSGLTLNGVGFSGLVTVDLGAGGKFSTETGTGFDVVEDASTVVAIEMRSPVWLQFVNSVLRRVDVDDFRQALRVRVGLRSALGI